MAVAVVATGAAVQASLGFGLSLIAAPLLLLIDRALVPGPLLAAAILLSILMAIRDHASIDVSGFRWGLAGRLLGTIPAVATLAVLSAQGFDLIFGVLVILAVVLSLIHPQVRPTRNMVFAAGTLSGYMGTISSIGGPPLALVYQHAEGARIRGTLSSLFLFGCIASLVGVWTAGLFDARQAWLAVGLLPGALLGFAISRWTVRWVDRGATRTLVLVLSLASACAVLARSAWGS
jgi:uncharacterized membrane protein YfcA